MKREACFLLEKAASLSAPYPFISFIFAFIILMIYMVVMYDFIPGMVANGALLLNLFFTMGIMASFQAAFSIRL